MERRKFLQLLGIAPVVPYVKLPKKDLEKLKQEVPKVHSSGTDMNNIAYYDVRIQYANDGKVLHRHRVHADANKAIYVPLRKNEGPFFVRVRAVDTTGFRTDWTKAKTLHQDKRKLEVTWT